MGTYELSVLGLRFSLLQKVGTRPIMSFIASTARTLVAASRASTSLTARRNFTDNVALKRWAFNASGFNQFGLYHDDCLYENEDVRKLLRESQGTCLTREPSVSRELCSAPCRRLSCPQISGPHTMRTGRREDTSSPTWKRLLEREQRRRTGTSRPRVLPQSDSISCD